MYDEPQVPLETDADQEELKSVREVLAQLTRTAKTLKLYLPNNPIYQKFLKEIYGRFDAHLKEYGDLQLRIRQYEMLYRGQAVYENLNSLESLAFKLYVDGLRELSFGEGLDLEEITDFLEIVSRKYDPDDPDDDIVTLLWERHLTHINYMVSEDFIHETINMPSVSDRGAVQEMAREEVASSQPAVVDIESVVEESLGIQLPERNLTAIFVLTEEEVARLKREMKREEGINLIAVLMDILIEILRIEKGSEAFPDTVNIVDTLLKTLITRGELSYVIRILMLYHEFMKPDQGLPMAHQESLKRSIKKASEPRLMEELGSVLERTDQIEPDQFYAFSLLLGWSAVVPLIELMGRLNRVKVRRTICEALVQLCKEDVEPLLNGLRDHRWYVVRNVLYILGKIRNPRCLDKIHPLVTHKEPRVRKELIHTLDGMKESKSRDLMILCLEDPHPAIRLQAVRCLAHARYRPALEPFLEIVRRRGFMTWDLREKKEWFESLACIGGNEMVPLFQEFLRQGSRAWFKKSAKEEMALCAVRGLRRIGDKKAQTVLMECQLTSRKKIREACEKAVKDLTR